MKTVYCIFNNEVSPGDASYLMGIYTDKKQAKMLKIKLNIEWAKLEDNPPQQNRPCEVILIELNRELDNYDRAGVKKEVYASQPITARDSIRCT